MNFAILLVFSGIGLAIFLIIDPELSLTTYPILEGSGLPLEAPSKFSLNHPCLGGDHIPSFRALDSCPNEGGILIPCQLFLILSFQEEIFLEESVEKPSLQFTVSTIEVSIELKTDSNLLSLLSKILQFLSFQISQTRQDEEISNI